MDKHENDNQPILTIAETDIDFEQVSFNEPKTRELIIANNCHIPANFEFSGELSQNVAVCLILMLKLIDYRQRRAWLCCL